jgi:hypothetical protein
LARLLKQIDRWPWIPLTFFALAAAYFLEGAGFNRRLTEAVAYTLLVFGAAVLAMRSAWHRTAFWHTLVLLIALHTLLLAVLFQGFPSARFPSFWFIVFGFGELILILMLLWKGAKSGRRAA